MKLTDIEVARTLVRALSRKHSIAELIGMESQGVDRASRSCWQRAVYEYKLSMLNRVPSPPTTRVGKTMRERLRRKAS